MIWQYDICIFCYIFITSRFIPFHASSSNGKAFIFVGLVDCTGISIFLDLLIIRLVDNSVCMVVITDVPGTGIYCTRTYVGKPELVVSAFTKTDWVGSLGTSSSQMTRKTTLTYLPINTSTFASFSYRSLSPLILHQQKARSLQTIIKDKSWAGITQWIPRRSRRWKRPWE
jgi:hypothetical protein